MTSKPYTYSQREAEVRVELKHALRSAGVSFKLEDSTAHLQELWGGVCQTMRDALKTEGGQSHV